MVMLFLPKSCFDISEQPRVGFPGLTVPTRNAVNMTARERGP